MAEERSKREAGREGQPREGTREGPQGREGAGRGAERPEEALLREQELSTERQREGHGWHTLPPGASRGTTALRKGAEGGEAREGTGAPPPAGRAEEEGQPPQGHGKGKGRGEER